MSVSEQEAWDKGYSCGKLDAADRIEALEAALREIKQLALNCQPAETPAALAHMVRICIDAGIARIALAPEQDK